AVDQLLEVAVVVEVPGVGRVGRHGGRQGDQLQQNAHLLGQQQGDKALGLAADAQHHGDVLGVLGGGADAHLKGLPVNGVVGGLDADGDQRVFLCQRLGGRRRGARRQCRRGRGAGHNGCKGQRGDPFFQHSFPPYESRCVGVCPRRYSTGIPRPGQRRDYRDSIFQPGPAQMRESWGPWAVSFTAQPWAAISARRASAAAQSFAFLAAARFSTSSRMAGGTSSFLRLYSRPSTPASSSKTAAAASSASFEADADRVLISLTRSKRAARASGVFRSSSMALQNLVRSAAAFSCSSPPAPKLPCPRTKSRFSRQVYSRSRLFLQLSISSTV